MSELADLLMLTGIEWPCPSCAEERLFVVPDPADAAARGADFACTDCGAAILIDPCSASADPLTSREVVATGAA